MSLIPRAATSRRGFIAGSLSGAGLVLLDGHAPAAQDKRYKQLVFRDRFERERAKGWGRSWFNQRYEHSWLVHNGYGRFEMPAPVKGSRFLPNPVVVLDHDVRDIELLATLAISDLSARGGLLVRGSGYFDFLIAYLDREALVLARCDYHDVKVLARKSHALNPSLLFKIRFRAEGRDPTSLKAKIWSFGYPEPQKWDVSARTSSPAVQGPGYFGLVTQHSNKKLPSSLASSEFSAYSPGTPRATPARLVYSLAGPPGGAGPEFRLVAKSSIRATVGFQFGTDPSFAGATVEEFDAKGPEYIATTTVDTGSLAAGTPVHWRAFVERNGKRDYGPASVFKKPQVPTAAVSFAFGSCAQWAPKVRKSFETAAGQNPDFFIQQGDFGYVRGGAAATQTDSYQDFWLRVLADPAVRALSSKAPVALIRDDSEYGRDRADRNTVLPFTIDAHGKLNANPSNDYHSFSYGGVTVFCLDCRRYSTGNDVPIEERTRLGLEQTEWLQQSMQDAVSDEAGLLVVSAPVAFGKPETEESWPTAYQAEWELLMAFFASLDAPVLIASGNSHEHKILEHPTGPQSAAPRVVEFVSSGTEQRSRGVVTPEEIAAKNVKANAFGLVELGPEEGLGDNTSRSVTLRCLKSGDGTEWFRSEYLAVKGIGLIPAL